MQYTSHFSVFDDYYASHLTRYELNQFKQSSQSCYLIDHILRPMLFNSTSYICVANIRMMTRHSEWSALISKIPCNDAFSDFQLFTNPFLTAPTMDKGDPAYIAPKDRVALCDHVILTMEFDHPDIAFFKQQLQWMRCSKKPSDSPIGRFLTDLRAEYADCVGINITYSGSKSFHYHIVFSTDLIRAHGTDFPSVREGYELAWNRVRNLMVASPHLDIPATITPDISIRFPDNFRRIPLGVRPVDTPKHLFGVPVGVSVPQVSMWESFFNRAAKGCANRSIFDPSDFLKPRSLFKRRSTYRATPSVILGDTPLLDYLEERIRQYFPDDQYPRFDRFGDAGGEIAAYFSNSPRDDTPDSIIKADRATVFLVGSDADTLDKETMSRLPLPLFDMIEEWSASFDALNASTERDRTPQELAFAQRAITHEAAKNALEPILTHTLGRAGSHWITAPEGISKSRSLFLATPDAIIAALEDYRLPTLTMYAFATYALAKEKMLEFRQLSASNPHRTIATSALTLKSFSRVYREACQALKLEEITVKTAVENGFNSLHEAIETMQPRAMEEILLYFRNKSARAFRKGHYPVIFTVHDVAHDWHKNTHTRRMFAPAYWSNDQENIFNRSRDQTRLGILIHDEIATHDLITMVPTETRNWIDTLRNTGSEWSRSSSSLLDRWQSYESLSSISPAPISFEETVKLTAIKQWDATITTEYNGEYGEPREGDIYQGVAGNEWTIKRADWMDQARTTIVLTTESVPTAVARYLGDPWQIIELDTPLLTPDSVSTVLHDRLTSAKLSEIVATERAKFEAANDGRQLLCISNKAKGNDQTTTHKTAKGSNGYMAQPVLQTMAMMSPVQYEQCEVLNALTGRTDMVLLTHLDEFNQSAGRNLGFRFRDGAEHHLVINRRLYICLATKVLAMARYKMDVVIGKYDRRNGAKTTKQSPALRALQAKLTAKGKLR